MEERQAYLKALEATTNSVGWRLIIEDCQKQIQAAREAMEAVTDLRQLGILQGRIGAFLEVITLDQHVDAQMTEAAEDADLQL